MAIVRREDEELPGEPDKLLSWIKERSAAIRDRFEDEDAAFLSVINKPVFAQM
jgi:hypothetical protein